MTRGEIEQILKQHEEVVLLGEQWDLRADIPVEEDLGIPKEALVIGYSEAGNYLFLKSDGKSGYEGMIYHWSHEGPEILPVGEIDARIVNPKSWFTGEIRYGFDNSPVKLGDAVSVKGWFRSREGEVTYLPGTSKYNSEYEAEDMVWVEIRFANGDRAGYPVYPAEHTLHKKIVPLRE